MVSVVLMVGWVLLSKTYSYPTPAGGFVKTDWLGRDDSGSEDLELSHRAVVMGTSFSRLRHPQVDSRTAPD